MRSICSNLAMIASSFLVGSSMDLRVPTKTQPWISLRTSHSPSSSSSFFNNTWSPRECPKITGGGNTLWITWSKDLDTWRSVPTSDVCTMIQKASTYTYMTLSYSVHVVASEASGHFHGGSMISSSSCRSCEPIGSFAKSSTISLVVYVAAQKNGGNSVQPICSVEGTTRRMRSPFLYSNT